MRKLVAIAALIFGVAALWGCGKKEEAPPQAVAPVVVPQPPAKAGAKVDATSVQAPANGSAQKSAATPKKAETKKPKAKAVSISHTGAVWRHFGADKAYKSREAALADVQRVLREAKWPEPVVALLSEAMKKPGTASHVTNGMKLDFMRSGKFALWRNVTVGFEKPPVSGNMEYAAPAEEWSVDWNGATWTVGIPKVCNNIYGKKTALRTVSAPLAALQPPVRTDDCPSGFTMIANAWSVKTFPTGLQQVAGGVMAAEKGRDSQGAEALGAYQGSAFSRTLGARLRKEVVIRAPVTATLPVRFVDMNPQTGKLEIREIGALQMTNGSGTFQFPDDPRKHVVETVWPVNFISPPMSGGAHRLRLFPEEWGRWCTLNVHGALE